LWDVTVIKTFSTINDRVKKMDISISLIAGSVVIGAVSGALYFGLLWVTVLRAVHSSHAERMLILSFIIRLSVFLLVFYAVLQAAHWQGLAAALCGFIGARLIILRISAAGSALPAAQSEE